MARFEAIFPNEIIKELETLEVNTPKMMGEMTKAAAEKVYQRVKVNMKKSFKTDKTLLKGLKITKTYRTPSDDGINTKVGIYGYDEMRKSKNFPNGVPIPLIANAREYGTSRGEARKPFFRKSFNKNEIENEMLKVQDEYLPKE